MKVRNIDNEEEKKRYSTPGQSTVEEEVILFMHKAKSMVLT